MVDIRSLYLSELEQWLIDQGEQKYRAKQIFLWLHDRKIKNFYEMTNIGEKLCKKLSSNFCLYLPIIEKKLESCIDSTVKYLYRLSDDNFVESVLMKYNYGYSLCISTQVGCRMGCDFCASGKSGFIRNLTAAEILSQVYASQNELVGERISKIVLMGIGEPLDNYDNVIRFLKIISNPNGAGISLRNITLSTCGIADKIDMLSQENFGLTLSVSLHFSDDLKRNEIMPVNRAYNIQRLLDSCRLYMKKTGRRVSFEYAVIDGINSSHSDAEGLARLLHGMNCHVNLIPVNSIGERSFSSRSETVKKFRDTLQSLGINATIRRTLGADIDAACGQLRRDSILQK